MNGEFLPRLDASAVERLAAEFRASGFVRIAPFLPDDTAAGLSHHLAEELVWDLSLRLGGRKVDASPAEQEKIGLKRLESMALAGADRELRYLFDVVRIAEDPRLRQERDLLVDRLADGWWSEQAMGLWRQITGDPAVGGLEIMATRYRPGHVLTRHDDSNHPGRVAAFVLYLSPKWKGDWGGLLQFLDMTGEGRSVAPLFNSLVLFQVPRDHLVSMVTPFAPVPRLAITGWFVRRAA
jgi:hypothetical protein